MRILHISDNHWRPLIRHEEYKEAFTDLFDKARALSIDCFVVCGDIVHEKTQRITPEIVDCLVWWFREMASIAPVHIMLGNHDGNLANKNRQDAISPIVEAINDDRIRLYKQSGNYELGGTFSLAVFSPFDEVGWQHVSPQEGKINIALFHGSVQGAITDIGYYVEGEVEPQFFQDYDFAFLGDIHKCQFLDSERRIAYCGSTIQQDFGENVDGHGFLLWDIKSKEDFEVSFHEIENKKPFVTIKWAGSVPKTMVEASKYPDGSRFRIYNPVPLSQKDFSQIFNEIRRTKKSNHIVAKYDKKEINKIDKDVANKLKRNLRDPSTVYKLLQQFYGEDEFTQEQWEKIEEILWSYIKSLDPHGDEVYRNTIWTPVRLEFSNIMNYGEDNVIDFTNLKGIVGIFGPNAAGKSTIIGAMAYALFGKLDREINQNHKHGIVNVRRSSCECKLTFRIGGNLYRICRTTQRIDKSDGRFGAKGNVIFDMISENGEVISSLNGETPKETDKEIKKLVGTIDDFKITALAPQKKLESFIEDYKTTERKKKLYKFRDLHVLHEFYNKALGDFKEIKGALKVLNPIDWDSSIEELKKESFDLETKLSDIANKIAVDKKIQEDLLKKLNLQEDKEVITQEQVDEQISIVEEVETDIEKLTIQIETIKARKLELQEKLEIVVAEKEDIPVKSIKEKIEKKNALDNKVSQLREKLLSEKKTLSSKQKTVSKLNVVPCGDQFPTCKYIVDAHKEKSNIKPQKELIEELEKEIQGIEILIVDDDDLKKQIKKYDDLCAKELGLVKKISSVTVETYETKLEYAHEKLKKERNTLRYLESNVSDEDASLATKEIRQRLSKVEKEIKERDSERIKIAGRMGSIESTICQYREEKIRFKEIEAKYKIYEKLSYAFGNKGIPNQIIRMDLPSLNQEIALVLRGAVNFDIELDVEEESDKLEIYINYGDSKRPIELGSGMEKAIAALAIRVGLMNASNLSKPDFLALDEAFDGLDESHIDSFVKVVESLQKWFKQIIIISHKESIKSMAHILIEINKKGKDSFVCYE